MVFLELRRDSRVTTGNSGCLLCWPRQVQSSTRVAKESWALLSCANLKAFLKPNGINISMCLKHRKDLLLNSVGLSVNLLGLCNFPAQTFLPSWVLLECPLNSPSIKKHKGSKYEKLHLHESFLKPPIWN